ASSSRVSAGSAGRYRSIEIGPKIVSSSRIQGRARETAGTVGAGRVVVTAGGGLPRTGVGTHRVHHRRRARARPWQGTPAQAYGCTAPGRAALRPMGDDPAPSVVEPGSAHAAPAPPVAASRRRADGDARCRYMHLASP